MPSDKVQTVLDYFKAAAEVDREVLRRCLGPGYVWIDHGAGMVAQSPEELRTRAEEHAAWSNVHYEIESAVEAEDGSVIVQVVKSGTVNGSWNSTTGSGQHVSYPICEIIRFDSEGRIIHEEGYYDMLSITKQLGH